MKLGWTLEKMPTGVKRNLTFSVMATSDKDRDGNDGNEDEMRPVEVLCIHSYTLH